MKTTRLIGVIAAIAIMTIAFSGVALAAETEVGPMAAALSVTTVLITVAMVIGVGLLAMFLRWSAKKGHTLVRPWRSVKAINAGVLLVLTAVNAKCDFGKMDIAKSPKVLTKIYKTNLCKHE
jgi:hypothetical protein